MCVCVCLPFKAMLSNVGVGEVALVSFKGRGNRYANSQESAAKAQLFLNFRMTLIALL